jgi:hypothetical protein
MKPFKQTSLLKPLERAKQLAAEHKISDASILFSIPGYHTSSSEAMVCSGDTAITGDLLLSIRNGPLSKKQIAMLFCFGDLTIDGELLIDDYEYWPLLFVQGNLTCTNILKGGMPLIVIGNIKTTYFIGEFNDGPMRVGGKLECLGYIPRVKEQGGIAGHIIAGGYNCPSFDAAKEHGRKELSRIFQADALRKGWLDSSNIRELGRAGKTIWLNPDQIANQQPTPAAVRPQKIELSGRGIDATALGNLVAVTEIGAAIDKLIEDKIEFNPNKNSYPQSFAEAISFQLKAHKNGKVLILPNNCVLPGLLILDWQEQWVERNKIVAVCCMGDLTVDGDIINRTLEGGPLLFVGGNLATNNLIKAGAPIVVLEKMLANGLVVGEYNDGTMRIGGDLTAEAYLLLDHDGFVRGSINARAYSDEENDWREVLCEAVFCSEDEDYPDVDLIYAAQKAGIKIFV